VVISTSEASGQVALDRHSNWSADDHATSTCTHCPDGAVVCYLE
jgi:hypothetical protein